MEFDLKKNHCPLPTAHYQLSISSLSARRNLPQLRFTGAGEINAVEEELERTMGLPAEQNERSKRV